MMKRVATDAEIRDAALALYAQSPDAMTITNVRTAVDGGSRTTLGPIVKQVRDEKEGELKMATNVPTAVRSKADTLLKAIMDEAVTHASQDYLARSARADASIAALETDVADAGREIDELMLKLDELTEQLNECKRMLDEKSRRVADAEAALVDEKVAHEQTKHMLNAAWDEGTALRREKSHTTSIGEQLESLNSIVAGLQASIPKRRAKRTSPRGETVTPASA